ncbi:hypothetical protein ANAPH2_01581 [Anaplasma phagocytophilum]|nr:hypothetical protein ANAPH2_01581 [Anaplasma phagocytophilum]
MFSGECVVSLSHPIEVSTIANCSENSELCMEYHTSWFPLTNCTAIIFSPGVCVISVLSHWVKHYSELF